MFNNRIQKIKGTKRLIQKNQLVVSTGIPSLDVLIGGGIPVGSCLLIEEDIFGFYSNIITKLYLAEGIVNCHSLLLAGRDVNPTELISTLPKPIHENVHKDTESKKNDQLRIAWRYQDLPKDQVYQKPSIFGNTFDFNYQMKVRDASITIFPTKWSLSDHSSYESLFMFIKTNCGNSKYNFQIPVVDRTVLRIALCSLGTASWHGNFITFLIKLRILLQNYCATCLITIPAHLFEHLKVVHRCEMLCDTVIELKSLIYDENLTCQDYDGLLLLKKLPIINTWNYSVPDSNDWAFKFTKKRFIVEKLHILPEDAKLIHQKDADIHNEYRTSQMISNMEDLF